MAVHRRFAAAVKRAQDNGYTRTIAAEFMARRTAAAVSSTWRMQESDFSRFAAGRRRAGASRKGCGSSSRRRAGDTACRSGRSRKVAGSGPGTTSGCDWEKATRAAASYIKDIYATDAQASGLLVMASYNWGEQRVIDLLRKMPSNPRERNFWKLLEKYRGRMPLETYNYVFSIVSAAVIGENPRLFGFQFDNPLAALEKG